MMENIRLDMILTTLAALSVLSLLGLVWLGNRLSAQMRRRVELGLALIFYPLLGGFFVWKAVNEAQGGDALTAAGWGLFALFILSSGARIAWRRLRPQTDGTLAS